MPKTTDVPPYLKDFNKVFEGFTYKWEQATAFHDFVDYCIACFSLDEEDKARIVERLKKGYGKQYELFPQLFRELVLAQNEALKSHEWNDVFGDYYMALSSASKASAMGQFFTPPEICNMMVHLNILEEPGTFRGRRINDPSCGSGRTLIAAHVIHPGNYFFGEDLDLICAKMSVVNFCLHGMYGQVSHMDSLKLEWFHGWSTGPMACRPITKEESFTYQSWHGKAEAEAAKPKPEAAPKPEPTPVATAPLPEENTPEMPKPGSQLKLF